MLRDLRLFYVFRLLATSYFWLPTFWLFMTKRGIAFDQIMLLSMLYSVVVILVEVPTGAFADRLGRRQSMMAGSLALVASGAVAFFAYDFWVFAIAEVLAAISMSLCSGADSAYLYDLLDSHGRREDYESCEGTSSAWHQAGSAAAVALGGLLGTIHLGLPYLATSVVGLAAFAIAMCMREEQGLVRAERLVDGGEKTPSGVRAALGRPWREELRLYRDHMADAVVAVSKSKQLIWTLSYSSVVFVLVSSTMYLYQPYLNSRGYGIAQTGFVFAGAYLLSTIAAYYGHHLRRWLGETTVAWGLLGALTVSFLLLNQIVGQVALLLMAIQAIAKGLFSPLVKSLLNREISESGLRATMLSTESIVRRLAMGVFSPIVGYFGAASAMYFCGGLGIAGIALLLVYSRFASLRGREVSRAEIN